MFPLLSVWLPELDSGRRGVDGHDFGSYAGYFTAEKYFRVCDITNLSVKDIMTICHGMARGTADKLLQYANKDVMVIRRKAMKPRQEDH